MNFRSAAIAGGKRSIWVERDRDDAVGRTGDVPYGLIATAYFVAAK
jgi:hypothetical protein